ncbi:MAG: shikimate dehydrogenase [Tardiphaga sp.]|nr:shikimate dehydrogenase [Tardiphaga sp.]
MITGTTRLYAIIGDPIAHVRVPMVFNDYFTARGIDAACVAIQIGRDDLAAGWAGLKSIRNLDGFIVTAPHKAGAGQLCDALDREGSYSGIANTVRRERDGSFTGTLLDGRGFVAGMKSAGHEVRGRRVYMAGSGGAGTALAFALADSGVKSLTIHNRTASRAEALIKQMQATFSECEVRLGTRNAAGHDIVINATALGLKPDDGFSFEPETADSAALFAEVIMKPEYTPLLLAARARGHQVHSGVHMLDGQLEMMMGFSGLSRPAA